MDRTILNWIMKSNGDTIKLYAYLFIRKSWMSIYDRIANPVWLVQLWWRGNWPKQPCLHNNIEEQNRSNHACLAYSWNLKGPPSGGGTRSNACMHGAGRTAISSSSTSLLTYSQINSKEIKNITCTNGLFKKKKNICSCFFWVKVMLYTSWGWMTMILILIWQQYKTYEMTKDQWE